MKIIIGIIISAVVSGWIVYRATRHTPDPDSVARQQWDDSLDYES